MKIDRTDIVTAITVPGLVSAAALTADGIYGTTAAAVEFGTAIAAGSLSWTSFSKKWPPALAWGSLALAGVSGQAWLTGTVGGFAALYGYAITAAAVFAGMVKHRHDTRHDAIKLEHETARLNTTLIRQQMAHHALVQKTTPEPVQSGPDLTGRTVEETRLRTVVHELFAAELPGCTVERTKTGWTAVLDLPVNLDRDKLRSAWPKVASGMGVAGEFMLADGALTNQLIARFIDGDPLADVVPYQRFTAARFTDPVHLGLDRFLNPVTVELAYSHAIVCGSSKFGKSTLVRSIIIQLADRPDVQLMGIDMKPGSPELQPMAPILQDIASTAEQAHALLDWLKEELSERGEVLAQAGDQEWDPATHGRPAIWVVIDELAELQRQGDGKEWGQPASKKLESLLALMRFAGMHLLAATQQPSRKVFGGTTDARGNFAVRISTRMNDKDHSRFVFGSSTVWNAGALDAPGKFLISSPDHQVPNVSRGMYLSGDQFRSEVARISSDIVDAPVGKRLILPVAGDSNRARVLNALAKYGNCTRRELETATGLSEKQVRDAARLCPEIERCEDTQTWRIMPVAAWEAQAVAKQ